MAGLLFLIRMEEIELNEISIKYTVSASEIQTKAVYQYDHGVCLHITGVDSNTNMQVHYSLGGSTTAIREIPRFENGLWVSNVPDVLLSQNKAIHAYIYVSNINFGKTVMHIVTPIIEKPKPADYELPKEDVDLLEQLIDEVRGKISAIDESLKNANDALSAAEQATKTANDASNAAQSAVNDLTTVISTVNQKITETTEAIESAENAATTAINAAQQLPQYVTTAQNCANATLTYSQASEQHARSANDSSIAAQQHAESANRDAQSISAQAQIVQDAFESMKNIEVWTTTLPAGKPASGGVQDTGTGKRLILGIPRGNPGVYYGPDEPFTSDVTVWINPDEEPDDIIQYDQFHIPVIDLSGDISAMNKDTKVELIMTFTDKSAVNVPRNKSYYHDAELTSYAGETDTEYRGYWETDNARYFVKDNTRYYIATSNCGPYFKTERKVTCKWQGSSSLYYPKKNYSITIVEYSNNFTQPVDAEPLLVKDDWGKQLKYCLKANWVDASNIRNILGAYQWGKLVKSRSSAPDRLKSLPNGGAIDGVPVWVNINGKPQGLYTMNIPKDAWMFGMTKEDANAGFVCADAYWFDKPAIGDESDISIEYASGDEKDLLNSFNNMINVLNSVQSEDDISALEEVLDINSVVDYILFSTLCCHHDGAVKNIILATYDGVKWFASAYDMDSIYGNQYNGEYYLHPLEAPYVDTMHSFRGGDNKLFSVITKYCRNYFDNRVWDVAFSNAPFTLNKRRLYEYAYNISVKFPKVLVDEDYRLWPSRPGTLTNNVNQILSFFNLRWDDFTDDESVRNLYLQIWPKTT
jgi:hypothetical protein